MIKRANIGAFFIKIDQYCSFIHCGFSVKILLNIGILMESFRTVIKGWLGF